MASSGTARTGGKELRVSAANLGFARRDHADFFAVLEDPGRVRKSGNFPGAERYLDIETYEMVDGGGRIGTTAN